VFLSKKFAIISLITEFMENQTTLNVLIYSFSYPYTLIAFTEKRSS